MSSPAAAPSPPDGAAALFGAALPGLERYVAWLAGEGTVRGLLGPREVPRLWDRHVVNCAGLAELVVPDRTVVDVGSGAGLPGLVLALVRPDLSVTLVDATARRTGFLAEVVDDLDLGQRVRVVTGRVEDLAVREQLGRAEVVTSRAVAPLATLLGWSLPLLVEGGRVLAIKGARARAEVAETDLRRARARVLEVHDVAYGGQVTTVVEAVPEASTRRTRPPRRSRSAGADRPGRPPRSGRPRAE